MNLKQIHDLARMNKSYSDFKSQVDKYFNGTPETVVDNTVYKVVKAEDTKESILTELIRLESILGDEQNDFLQIGKQRAYRDIRCFIQK